MLNCIYQPFIINSMLWVFISNWFFGWCKKYNTWYTYMYFRKFFLCTYVNIKGTLWVKKERQRKQGTQGTQKKHQERTFFGPKTFLWVPCQYKRDTTVPDYWYYLHIILWVDCGIWVVIGVLVILGTRWTSYFVKEPNICVRGEFLRSYTEVV